MMIYLKNMAGFKMDYFKGMSYDDIRPIFQKKFNSNVAFLEKTKEQMEAEDSKALKRASESQAKKATKKQKLDEEQADDVADEGVASVDVDVVPAAVEDASKQGEIIANIDTDKDVTLKDVAVVEKDAKIQKNTYGDELEPAELKEVVEVVTTAELMTEVVTAASATITAATTPITAAPSAARRRKGVVIRDPKEAATPSIIIHSEPKSKDKGKGIIVEEPKPLKKQAQIEALKRASESQAEKAAKKQKLNKEVKELKKHLQIVPNDEDDIYSEATPLARKTSKIYTKGLRLLVKDLLLLSQVDAVG
nr:hypothetical protein [Tanacetum cinerariifolium]